MRPSTIAWALAVALVAVILLAACRGPLLGRGSAVPTPTATATATATPTMTPTLTPTPAPAGAPAAGGAGSASTPFDKRFYAVPCRSAGLLTIDEEGGCWADITDVQPYLDRYGVSQETVDQIIDLVQLGKAESIQIEDDNGQMHDAIRRPVLVMGGLLNTGRYVYASDGLILIRREDVSGSGVLDLLP